MSKNFILVIDTPEVCFDCKFCHELHEGMEAICEISDELDNKKLCIEIDYYQGKPDWCPIRNLPEKKPYKAMSEWLDFNCGWNACIDKILKGVDGNE